MGLAESENGGQDKWLMPCTRTHASHSVPVFGGFYTPIPPLHTCKSHTGLLICTSGLIVDVIVAIVHKEPERRSSRRFGMIPFKIFGPLRTLEEQEDRDFCLQSFCMWTWGVWGSEITGWVTLTYSGYLTWASGVSKPAPQKEIVGGSLPSAYISYLWNWYFWVLGGLIAVRRKLQEESSVPTQGQQGCERCLSVCGFRLLAAWHISSFTDLNSRFLQSLQVIHRRPTPLWRWKCRKCQTTWCLFTCKFTIYQSFTL